ncbi:MAG TPA: squalene/phytoene synthase family protein [Vicinamibacterales bacterium]|nr:squalene/phytoene synthase family protein [Vicinamibacterales bacterium]
MTPVVADLGAAYASCERRARSHYENFPVASWLLPRPMRKHVAAVYAFARVADDFADEGDLPRVERLRLLGRWQQRLLAAHSGGPQPERVEGEPDDSAAIFLAVGGTLRQCSLPVDLFADLLDAFRQDVEVSSYADWHELFDYARRSANPVGRLVLRIAGYRDSRLDEWSDAICTGLQFTNFWQDIDVDAARGRVYLPRTERSLGPAIGRTRDLFAAGRPLCEAVRGRLRYELRATWLGGMRILDRVDVNRDLPGDAHKDVPRGRPFVAAGLQRRTTARPVLGLADLPSIAWHTLMWMAR